MITLEQQKQGAELMQSLVQKAWESAEFKEQLIENPVEALGLSPITESKLKIVVEDQSDDSIIFLNIPFKNNMENFELTSEQLELISGGDSPGYDLGYAWMNHNINMFKAGCAIVAAGATWAGNIFN
jgi:hypothetical protein